MFDLINLIQFLQAGLMLAVLRIFIRLAAVLRVEGIEIRLAEHPQRIIVSSCLIAPAEVFDERARELSRRLVDRTARRPMRQR